MLENHYIVVHGFLIKNKDNNDIILGITNKITKEHNLKNNI